MDKCPHDGCEYEGSQTSIARHSRVHKKASANDAADALEAIVKNARVLMRKWYDEAASDKKSATRKIRTAMANELSTVLMGD
jgi:hypothetical protein